MPIRILAKLVILGGLSLALLVILASINGLVRERRYRQLGVEREIAESYAGEQQIVGPFLMLKLREDWTKREYNREKDAWFESPQSETRWQRVFPDTLTYEAEMREEERQRGIFKARVFQSEGKLTGQVSLPAADSLRIREGAGVELLEAALVLLVSDPRGLSKVPVLSWQGEAGAWRSGTPDPEPLPGIQAPLTLALSEAGESFRFSVDLHLHGTGGLHLTPIASENQIRLTGTWPHPSFVGQFLPVDRKVSSEGFSADWNVNGLASSARQALSSRSDLQRLGVLLIDPINPYPLTDRALKYAFLFIGITFAAFLLFEMTRGLRIHPVQYGFVGFAQALFFLLLLSLSEHMSFGLSYAIASAGTIGLITHYLCFVLRGLRSGLGFGGLLAALYAALYGLLQSEDHALLAGSGLLFVLLTAVMVLTRKLDWYALTQSVSRRAPPPLPPAG